MTTLTIANSSFTISVPNVSPVPIPIVGYQTDDAFESENVSPNEVKMGVDGIMSAGHTPYVVKLKFVLMADSLSNAFMDLWNADENQANETYYANATIVAPSLLSIFTFTKGAMTGYTPIPPGKKIAEARTYEITFQSKTTAPV